MARKQDVKKQVSDKAKQLKQAVQPQRTSVGRKIGTGILLGLTVVAAAYVARVIGKTAYSYYSDSISRGKLPDPPTH
jgi:hypothetical protein